MDSQLTGCAASKIDGLKSLSPASGCQGRSHLHLPAYGIDIALSQLHVDSGVEATVDAAAFTKGNMNVETSHHYLQNIAKIRTFIEIKKHFLSF
jgi:hypothetical protein